MVLIYNLGSPLFVWHKRKKSYINIAAKLLKNIISFSWWNLGKLIIQTHSKSKSI